jgi:hypothetical protein
MNFMGVIFVLAFAIVAVAAVQQTGGGDSSPLSPNGGEGLGVRGRESPAASPPSPRPSPPRGERE